MTLWFPKGSRVWPCLGLYAPVWLSYLQHHLQYYRNQLDEPLFIDLDPEPMNSGHLNQSRR